MERRHLCLGAVLIGSIAATLMQNFITVSLPTLVRDIGGASSVGWIVGSYMLASTLVLFAAGRWADHVGPRRVYVVGTLVYAAATLLAATAQSMPQLIVFRIIQGAGAGLIVPAGMASITRFWHGERLGRMIGVLGMTQVLTTVVGAPVGGWLTEHLGWRTALRAVVVLSGVALALSATLPVRSAPESTAPAPTRRLLQDPRLRRGVIGTAGLSSLVFAASVYLPLALTERSGADASTLGWMVLPLLAGVGVGSAIGGARAMRRRTQELAWCTAVAGVALCLVPMPPTLIVGGALIGLGVGIGMPAIFVAVQSCIPRGNEAQASGLIQFARNLGGGIGVPVYGASVILHVPLTMALPATFATMLAAGVVGLILTWSGVLTVVPAAGPSAPNRAEASEP